MPIKPPFLYLPRRHHPFADVGTALRRFVGGQLLVADRRYLYVQVNANRDYMYQKSCLEKYT
jgi:hypothetical protein